MGKQVYLFDDEGKWFIEKQGKPGVAGAVHPVKRTVKKIRILECYL